MLGIIFSVNTLWWAMLGLYIPACFALIIIVLLQKGKGQGLAGAFGMGGGMDTIFGPRSSKSLPQKITYASAGVFMTLALVMSILSGKVGRPPAPELVAETPEASMSSLFEPSEANTSEVETSPVEGATQVEVTETAVQEDTGEIEETEPATGTELLLPPGEAPSAGAADAGSDSDSPIE